MGDSTKDAAGSAESSSQSAHMDVSGQKESPLNLQRSDTSSTKASKKSTESASSGSQLNGYPSQISYNANTMSNGYGHHIRMQPPPPISPGQIRSNGVYQFNDPMAAGGYQSHVHAYQMSSSPVLLTTQAPPSGITYSPNSGNFPTQIINPNIGGGLPPTAPAMQYQSQDMSSSTHSSRNRRSRRYNHRRSNSYNGPSHSSYGSTEASANQSFFSPVGSGAPPLPRGRNKTAGSGDCKRMGSADFSPVSEIRKLTGSERGIRPPAISPSARGKRSHNRSKSEDWQRMRIPLTGTPPAQMFTAPSPKNQNQPYPQQQPPQPMIYNPSVYMERDLVDEIGPFTGSMRIINGNGMQGSFRKNSEDDGSDAGGEAVFLLNKNSSRKESTRGKSRKKRHMRQRSAQLFMENVKGTEQMPSCRDIVFLLFFVFHLLGIIHLGKTYGNEVLRFHDDTPEDSESSVTFLFSTLIYLAALCGVFAMVISGLTLLLMTIIANKIVQIALILSITFSFVWGTMGIGLSPKKIVPITGIVALTLSVGYAFIVWDRIPFAAANLNAALTGIIANPGAIFIAFVFQLLALGWSIYYTFVGGGVYDAIKIGVINESYQGAEYVYCGLLAVSYYWTLNVFLNIVQVTVAGVIGKWWYTVDGDVASRNVDLQHAFFRSIFYSIGSICFGSLLVAPVRVLRQFSVFFRPTEEVSSLMTLHECMHCIQTCMTNFVESLARRFNSWSFTYVGLYGYSITDAGLRSAELFEKRGWTTIVSDELVPNVLLLITLAITGLTGVFAHFLEQFEPLSITATDDPLVTPFVVGALVGLVVSSVLFGIISSSVNAVIVLFATSPVDFEQNHPELSEEMRNAWREVWPGCMEILDGRHQVGGFLDPLVHIPPQELYGAYNPAFNGSIRSHSERHPLLR
eukprot:CAMPEP_0197187966 /NCGR_PEP_ID=MMETSP1423-20130617/16951_1 /TAXON_ID=476441 /ORGANISM="Pseudo-nitzschia heimii, Strain UNC1101" /LENGTH=909 /DNA_ID=CAMNT_0042639687 /DNA_START=107 /DNA_END=2836 /DNA_ORIENTATION=+